MAFVADSGGLYALYDADDAHHAGAVAAEDDVHRCRKIIEQYRDLDLGLADAAVVATAERLSIQRILTVDQRHFRAVIPESGIPFVLLPADA